MTTVYVLTAGSGVSYRLDRVFLAANSRVRPVTRLFPLSWFGGGMAGRCPPSVYDGP